MAGYGQPWPWPAKTSQCQPWLAMASHGWPWLALVGHAWPCLAMPSHDWPCPVMAGHSAWSCEHFQEFANHPQEFAMTTIPARVCESREVFKSLRITRQGPTIEKNQKTTEKNQRIVMLIFLGSC